MIKTKDRSYIVPQLKTNSVYNVFEHYFASTQPHFFKTDNDMLQKNVPKYAKNAAIKFSYKPSCTKTP